NLIAAEGKGLFERAASISSASASRLISTSDKKRSTLRTGAFLTPSAGLSTQRPRSIAKAKIALTNATHCPATPLPPVAKLPDRRPTSPSIFSAVLPSATALRIRSTSTRTMRSVDLLRESGEFLLSDEELDETATTVYEGICTGSGPPGANERSN